MAVGQHGRMSATAQEAQDEVLGAITPAVQELAAIAEEHALPARIAVHDLPALRGLARGVGAHAAVRLQGVSAIDRYLSVHAALAEHERGVNAAVAHPLMARLELAYPLLVGRLSAGRWSSQVPDELKFEGRLGVAVGADLAQARAALEQAVAAADDDRGPATEIRWHSGQVAPAQTPVDDLVRVARAIALTILRFGS
jgi:acetylornithine deacetylase/succinyl-diaminopimelate desuccinylase-like protein